jgi:hypothetical protein
MFIAVGYVYLLPISIIQTRMGVVLTVSSPSFSTMLIRTG